MAAKRLTELWREAAAAKPSDWQIKGVVRGPRDIDPKLRSTDEWCAWARGPDKERVEGRGPVPHDALYALTLRLKELDA
jgi:hypothetical protein